MTPAGLLGLLTGISAAASIASGSVFKARQRKFRELATKWGMNYAPSDQLRLSERVARGFPIPGAARIRVTDLIFGAADDSYRYVFTAEYTLGVIGEKKRMLRAATFSEPRDPAVAVETPAIRLAPGHLPILEQYERLWPDDPADKGRAPRQG